MQPLYIHIYTLHIIPIIVCMYVCTLSMYAQYASSYYAHIPHTEHQYATRMQCTHTHTHILCGRYASHSSGTIALSSPVHPLHKDGASPLSPIDSLSLSFFWGVCSEHRGVRVLVVVVLFLFLCGAWFVAAVVMSHC